KASLDQRVHVHGAKTSFIRIELDAKPLFAGSIVHAQSNIRMRIVAGCGYQSTIAFSNRVIPSFQVLCRANEKVRKHQLRIAPIRPEAVEEQHRWVRGACICE